MSPYLVAEIGVLTDVTDGSIELEAMGRNAKKAFEQICEMSQTVSDEVKVELLNTDVPGNIADLIAPLANLSLEACGWHQGKGIGCVARGHE